MIPLSLIPPSCAMRLEMRPETGRHVRRLRAGLTLMEVLVSIFIMAIGMLALLTLFPLGALRIDQAIKDERTAQAAVQATAYAKILDLANDPTVRYSLMDPNRPGTRGAGRRRRHAGAQHRRPRRSARHLPLPGRQQHHSPRRLRTTRPTTTTTSTSR